MTEIDEKIYNLKNKGFRNAEIAEILKLDIEFVKRRFLKRYKESVKRKQEKEEKDRLFEMMVIEKIPLATSMNNLCNLLGLKGVDGYYNKIKRIIKKNNLNVEHFTIWSSSKKHGRNMYTAMTDDEYFVNGIKRSGVQTLNRLIKKGYKVYKCEECGISEWNGKPLRLQIHHVNGKHDDNRINNIQLLCPNCHTQTDTYGRNNTPKRGLRHIKYTIKKQLKLDADANDIINSFKELKSFLQVGKKYGVSDNAIRKRVKKLGIYEEVKKYTKYR